MNKSTKAKVKTKERHITILIVPPAGGNLKAVKIYYPKLVISAVLCIILCGTLMAGTFARNLIHENDELRANNIQLHEVNRAEFQVIKENEREIKDIQQN